MSLKKLRRFTSLTVWLFPVALAQVTADRARAAAYTITTLASPTYGGTTSGDGVYNEGMPVTVQAFANPGFTFVDWTWLGTSMSASPSFTFPATSDMNLVANFTTATTTVTFDFDYAPIHTSLPLDLTVDGLTAHCSATGSGFSIQAANTMGFTPPSFARLCLYPNSVFAADLLVSFSQHLTDFSILYSPQELGCDDSARMRVTAYLDGVSVGTATTTAQFPGTWPSETLSITPPSEFNSVVVHYDARPPTCQDWGPIFMADNMIVNRVAAPTLPPIPLGDPSGYDKTRFISFSIPASASSAETALRVNLTSLHHVVPPYTGGASIPFTAFEGQSRWVGPPTTYMESNASGIPFQASALQCTPYYQDWSTISILHVTGSAIVPSSVYEVENLAASCAGVEATCADVSGVLTINTTRWGDVEAPYVPPNPSGQPDFGDVSALLNKFKSTQGAPIKARALLAGDDVFGNISPAVMTVNFSFAHIAACVDGFRGQPYPYAIQTCP